MNPVDPGPGDPGPGLPPPETEAIGGTSATTAFDATSVVREFAYDDTDRMRQVMHDGVVAMSYLYNSKGEQVYKTGSDKTIATLYDEAGHWVGDYDANGQPINQQGYLWNNGYLWSNGSTWSQSFVPAVSAYAGINNWVNQE